MSLGKEVIQKTEGQEATNQNSHKKNRSSRLAGARYFVAAGALLAGAGMEYVTYELYADHAEKYRRMAVEQDPLFRDTNLTLSRVNDTESDKSLFIAKMLLTMSAGFVGAGIAGLPFPRKKSEDLGQSEPSKSG